MHFFAIFSIFATAFVLVQCDYFQSKKHYDYVIPTEVDCKSVRKAVIGTMMNSTCKPHYRHVPLKAMPSHEYYPSIASVKRCDGHCPGSTCLPISTQMIKVPVKLTTQDRNGNSNVKCALVEVLEHTKCRCKCEREASECNEKQYYAQDRCACVCINQESAKRECETKEGMLWNDEDCSCNCTQLEIQCLFGMKWNRDKCECM